MLEKNIQLSALATRKKLLIAESEINREQMMHEWRQMRTMGSAASILMVFAAGAQGWFLRQKRSAGNFWQGLISKFGFNK